VPLFTINKSCANLLWTYQLFINGANILPSGITWNNVSKNLVITKSTPVGIYKVKVKGSINDGTFAETSEVTLDIGYPNTGPPTFDSSLPMVFVKISDELSFDLPTYTDPDLDSVTVNFDKKPTFATYSGGKMTFKPKKPDLAMYFITIILEDVNKRGSKSTTY